MANNNSTISKKINDIIGDIKAKNFKVYFFVVDSKNIPNGDMMYVYQIARELYITGYNVTMLYQLPNEYTEDEIKELNRKESQLDESRVFGGVGEWLGNEYMEIPHMNIMTNEWNISPSDFLFIPEVFSSLMFETYKHNIPCKRYVIVHNYNYVTDFIPLGVQWSNYGIHDAVCVTDKEAELVKSVFPYVKTRTLKPYIDEQFRTPIKPKNLIVNIIAKDQNDVNKIVKPFYWKYPVYKFISFRDIRNFPHREYSELLKEGAITVWIDDETPFGYAALEAMKCGNIVIGKVPDNIPEWMMKDGVLKNNGIWFDDINDVHSLLSSVIGSWMNDDVPTEITNEMNDTNEQYRYDNWKENVASLFENIISDRITELDTIRKSTKTE